jgi:hypothetical protein
MSTVTDGMLQRANSEMEISIGEVDSRVLLRSSVWQGRMS